MKLQPEVSMPDFLAYSSKHRLPLAPSQGSSKVENSAFEKLGWVHCQWRKAVQILAETKYPRYVLKYKHRGEHASANLSSRGSTNTELQIQYVAHCLPWKLIRPLNKKRFNLEAQAGSLRSLLDRVRRVRRRILMPAVGIETGKDNSESRWRKTCKIEALKKYTRYKLWLPFPCRPLWYSRSFICVREIRGSADQRA